MQQHLTFAVEWCRWFRPYLRSEGNICNGYFEHFLDIQKQCTCTVKLGMGSAKIGGHPVLILYTLTSVCIFSIQFCIHFLKCWQGEVVKQWWVS